MYRGIHHGQREPKGHRWSRIFSFLGEASTVGEDLRRQLRADVCAVEPSHDDIVVFMDDPVRCTARVMGFEVSVDTLGGVTVTRVWAVDMDWWRHDGGHQTYHRECCANAV